MGFPHKPPSRLIQKSRSALDLIINLSGRIFLHGKSFCIYCSTKKKINSKPFSICISPKKCNHLFLALRFVYTHQTLSMKLFLRMCNALQCTSSFNSLYAKLLQSKGICVFALSCQLNVFKKGTHFTYVKTRHHMLMILKVTGY